MTISIRFTAERSKKAPIISPFTHFLIQWKHYISSQVGFVQLGGRQLNRLLADEFQDVRETQHFMHLNSVFRAYLSGELGKLTVGVGPYVNVPLGNDEFDSRLFNGFSYERIHTGLKGEVGILKDIDRLRIGIMGSYLFDLTPVASTEFMDIGIDATSIFVSIGYRIADDQAKQ